MIEAQKAAFSFEEFKVPQFAYNEAHNNESNIKIGLSPSGVYDASNGIFELKIVFLAHVDGDLDKAVFNLTTISKFKFDSNIELEQIPSYFYKNAIAIVFPYIRAFISTLTLQANTKLMRIGLMNLSDLEKPLRDNTVKI